MILTELMKSSNDKQKGTEIISNVMNYTVVISYCIFFRHNEGYVNIFTNHLNIFFLYMISSELFLFLVFIISFILILSDEKKVWEFQNK